MPDSYRNFANLPVDIISHLAPFLLDDRKDALETTRKASLTCKSWRSVLWPEILRNVVLDPERNGKAFLAIKREDRHHIRSAIHREISCEIIIKVLNCMPLFSNITVISPEEEDIGQSFGWRLQEFILTCPNLKSIDMSLEVAPIQIRHPGINEFRVICNQHVSSASRHQIQCPSLKSLTLDIYDLFPLIKDTNLNGNLVNRSLTSDSMLSGVSKLNLTLRLESEEVTEELYGELLERLPNLVEINVIFFGTAAAGTIMDFISCMDPRIQRVHITSGHHRTSDEFANYVTDQIRSRIATYGAAFQSVIVDIIEVPEDLTEFPGGAAACPLRRMEMHVVEGKHTYSSSFIKDQGKVESFIAAKLAWDDQIEKHYCL